MKNYSVFLSAIIFATMLLLSGCGDDDDPVAVNEEEEITTVLLSFTKVGGSEVQEFTWQDLDGDGGNDPIIDDVELDANSEYSLTIQMLNENEETTSDEYNITAEVEEEAEEHQLFFEITNSSLVISYDDEDEDDNPIGLSNTATTVDASTGGTLTVVLRHEPDKGADGVSDGEIDNAGGDTDIETTFNVTINE